MRKPLAWIFGILGLGLFLAYLLVPTTKTLQVRFWTREAGLSYADAQDARLYINDKSVGGPSSTFRVEELREHFDPALTPPSWPPDGTAEPSYEAAITDELAFEVRMREGNLAKGDMSHIVYLRVKDGHQETIGAFRVKVVGAGGKTALYAGSQRSHSVEEQYKAIHSTVELQFHFPDDILGLPDPWSEGQTQP